MTIPKAVADRYGIEPGDEIDFVAAGEGIRVQRRGSRTGSLGAAERVELFDRATERQRCRQSGGAAGSGGDRGWRREDLYERAGAR